MQKANNVPPEHVNIAILGAGLSGLAVAYHLEERGVYDYTIFERGMDVGGLNGTKNVNGFLLDHGPHLFFTRDEYVVKLMEKLLKDNLLVRKSNPWQFSYGKHIKYPYTVNMNYAPKKIREKCIRDFRRAWQNKIDNERLGIKPEIKTYSEWCYYHYGKGFAELFLFKYARKYWTLEPADLTTEWIGEKIYVPSLAEVERGARQRGKKNYYYYNKFRYPKNRGAGALTEAFYTKIRSSNVKFNCPIKSIDEKKKLLELSDGTMIRYNKLVSSLPLPSFAKMLKNAPPPISESAEKLVWTSVMCILVGVDRSSISEKSWIYFDDPKTSFFRLSFPKHFSPSTCPRGKSSVWAEVVYSKRKPIDKKKIIAKVLNDLKRHKILRKNDKILALDFFDSYYAYSIYDMNWSKSVGSITEYLRANDIETCGRFGKWEYLWTYQVILDAVDVARRISDIL